MSNVAGVIPNVIGGISQQPGSVRLENTATDLMNAVPSVVSGLRKRPYIRHISDLMPTPSANPAIFTLDRPGKPVKIITVADGVLRVFNEDGTEEPVTVTVPESTYLDTGTASEDIGFTVVGDTVFVFNRSVIVETAPGTEGRQDPSTQITCVLENVSGSEKWKFTMSGSGYTQIGSISNDADRLYDTDYMARQLSNEFDAGTWINDSDLNQTSDTVFTSYVKGNVMIIDQDGSFGGDTKSVADASFELSPASISRAYRKSVQKFTHLPLYEKDGRIVMVNGDPEDSDDSYWVQYDANTRTWTETAGYNAREYLVPLTMPVTLKDNGDGTWTLSPHTWGTRKVGDEESNKTPSFVGFGINDMFILGNRMCILADEFLVASEVDNYENFYRTTCTTLLDSDRIDTACISPSGKVARLYHGVEFDSTVVLFSDQSQFAIDTENGFSPKTIKIDSLSSYTVSKTAKPVRMGSTVLFVDDADEGEWADIREYMIDEVVGTHRSELVTKQVPNLIPTGVTQIETNATLGLTLVLTAGDPDRIYVHSLYRAGNDTLQSAWSYWEDKNVEFLKTTFIGNSLSIVYKRLGRIHLARMNLHESLEGDFDGLEINLDYRINEPTVLWDGSKSIVTLPYDTIGDETYYAVLTSDGVDKAGTAYGLTHEGSNQLTLAGINLSNETFVVGKSYRFLYELSPIYLRDQGKVPIQDGRFQLRRVSFLFHQSSSFEVTVTNPGRSPYTYSFEGRVTGSFENSLGKIAVSGGEFPVPVMGESSKAKIVVINDSPFNCRFTSVEWDGSWRPKKRRYR